MNEILKKTLMYPLLAATKSVDALPVLQRILRNISFPRKTAIIRRLNKFPNNRITASCRGISFELDLEDLLQREIYYNTYDAKKLPFLLRYIKREGTYLDVGANVGFYSLHMAKKINGKGRVYAIEADPSIFNVLKRNCENNPFGKQVKVFSTAIAHLDGQLNFYLHEKDNSGAGSLTKFDHICGEQIQVSAMTLDRFMEQEGISYVDLLKVDIESNEFELLEGAKKSLREKRFGKIYIEFNGILLAKKGKNFHDFLNAFAEYGYSLIDINLDIAQKLQSNTISSSAVCTDFLFSATKSMPKF